MNRRITFAAASVLATSLGAAFCAPAAVAAPPAIDAAPAAESAMQRRLAAEEASLRPQRIAFQGYFRQAYARYPTIPAGTLEAIAYVQSRWMQLQPGKADSQDERHLHMPFAHGVMGLYAGEGFADQVGEAAHLLGVERDQVMRDARLNILGAAALLDREIRRDLGAPDLVRAGGTSVGRADPGPERIRPALMRYAGFSPSPAEAVRASAAGDYARTSFAYDVLLAQDRGVNDRGIVVPERAIAWEQAFEPDQLVMLRAPMLRLDAARDRIDLGPYRVDPLSETLQRAGGGDAKAGTGMLAPAATDVGIQSTDYGPALWVPSPYYRSRSSYSSVTIHTAQGSYAGTINWFKSNPYSVSAHYVIRSSDGQVTQMVRNANGAHHVGVHNGTTLGIEHEGYVNNSSWYTTAMYNSSAALVRSFCSKYSAISCANAYNGPSHSGVVVLSTSIDVKGHQHYSSQTHTDPGINWDWRRYYTLLNPGSGGTTKYLDRFESSVGHFTTSPTYSGSTRGISTASSATRTCSTRKNGSCSLRVLLKDNASSSANWSVRLLSGAGNPSSNTALTRANGKIGFWVYAGGSGMKVGVGIDDSDGTERSTTRTLSANTWTYVSWSLTDAAQWNAWVGGNGAITAGTVKLDAIWIERAQTSYDVNVYIDDVQIRN
ncbi:N-acetylmuramoyl-L-alanine amidase [Marilutibacter spongiae]|nr:N-acetylmuramoyl-L-alanine amidase [Lysobacter spongiae]